MAIDKVGKEGGIKKGPQRERRGSREARINSSLTPRCTCDRVVAPARCSDAWRRQKCIRRRDAPAGRRPRRLHPPNPSRDPLDRVPVVYRRARIRRLSPCHLRVDAFNVHQR